LGGGGGEAPQASERETLHINFVSILTLIMHLGPRSERLSLARRVTLEETKFFFFRHEHIFRPLLQC